MEDDEGQLKVNSDKGQNAPAHIWKTALGRAVFGFYAETHSNSYFVNDVYIERLCQVETSLSATYGKIVFYGFLFSVFSIATASKAIDGAEYFGLSISRIPYLTEFCSLALGVLVMVSVHMWLDLFALIRMRMELFSTTGSESPHMRMVHMKGSGAWMDAILPKSIGYSSGTLHKIFQLFSISWAFLFPLVTLMVPISAQAACITSVPDIFRFNLSSAMVWAGILVSSGSIVVLLVVAFVPLRFSLKGRE